MNESINKSVALVGLFVLIGLLFLVAGVFFIGSLHKTFESKINVVSIFDDVKGLQKGNYVWFSGVKIGTISDLRFYGLSQVKVSLKIDKEVQQHIRKDSKVKLGSDGFIGNKILIIYGGTENSVEVQEGDTLQVGETLSTEDMMNTLQDNNKNLLAITKKLAAGEGTIGKLLNDSLLYTNINTTIVSLQNASAKAQQIISSLADFSSGLNKKGSLTNELTTDTMIFKSLTTSVIQLQQIADTATVFITNLKQAGSNPHTSIGILLHDEEAGAHLKESIKNLESSSKKLDEDLEAAQHNFLLRGFFKKKTKDAKSENKPD